MPVSDSWIYRRRLQAQGCLARPNSDSQVQPAAANLRALSPGSLRDRWKHRVENIHRAKSRPSSFLITGSSGSGDIGGVTVYPAQGVKTLP